MAIIESTAAELPIAARAALMRVVHYVRQRHEPSDMPADTATATTVDFCLLRLNGDWGDHAADQAISELTHLADTREAIEAHLTIVFTALAVSHCIQERTGLAIGNLIKQLRPLRTATITVNGVTETFPPDIPRHQRKILASLGIPEPGH